jgi:hypothetical protein
VAALATGRRLAMAATTKGTTSDSAIAPTATVAMPFKL